MPCSGYGNYNKSPFRRRGTVRRGAGRAGRRGDKVTRFRDFAAAVTGRRLSEESRAQLVERARWSLAAFCAFLAVFAVSDFLYSREHLAALYGLKALQLVVVAAALRALASETGQRHAVPILLAAALVIFANIAAGATVIGDVLITPMTVMGIALLIGGAYPWGSVAQAVAAAGGAAAVAGNAAAVGGAAQLLAYPQLAAYVGFFMSVWVAHVFERHRQAAEQADLFGALARLGSEMVSSLEPAVLLRRLCELTAVVLDCEVSRTFLRNEDGSFVPVAWHEVGSAPEKRPPPGVPVNLSDSFVAELAGQDVVVLPAGARADTETQLLRDGGELGEVLLLPLRDRTQLIGLHTAGRRRERPFTPRDRRVAGGMARIASMALQNAMLFERAEEASRLKSDFVATMSHELRTPLHVIIGYTQILLEQEIGLLNPQQEDTARRIDANARRLLELIEATLDVSRLDSGRVAIRQGKVSLPEVLAELRDEIRCDAAVELCWELADDLPDLVTDPVKLRVILKNLVSNAVKFTPCGRVTVGAARSRGGVEVAVRDTGIGIPPQAQAFIFEPFRQAHDDPGRVRGGVGLGLYIVRRLVELLGGEIHLESELGRGSTFRVWIPERPRSQNPAP